MPWHLLGLTGGPHPCWIPAQLDWHSSDIEEQESMVRML